MADVVKEVGLAVRDNLVSFCKIITPNDAGMTGAHQAGLYIPKDSTGIMFEEPGERGENKEKNASLSWFDGKQTECRFVYYGQGTRNEYRITRLGRHFRVGDLVVIVKMAESNYLGYVISTDEEIDRFVNEFGLDRDNVNGLIYGKSTDYNLLIPSISEMQESLPVSSEMIVRQISFRPKAHILVLLGEELIKSPVMAIYELVKNSYDADAGVVDVSFENIEDIDSARIIIQDTGTGITEEVLENVWFEPGTDFRKPVNKKGQREVNRSPIHKRIPMGEKGVGRFAVHKLGNKIRMITRPAKVILNDEGLHQKLEILDYELVVDIDWRRFSQSKYLEDVHIEWTKNLDQHSFHFKETHGTYIEISSLKEVWTRGMARQLKRHTMSMVSPKNDPGKFRINLDFRNWWLENMPETSVLLQQAPYKLTVLVDSAYNMTFEYRFELANNSEVGSRSIDMSAVGNIDRFKYERNVKSELKPFFRNHLEDNKEIDRQLADDFFSDFFSRYEESPVPYGGLLLEFYSFDLDPTSLKDISTTPKMVRDFLKEHAGVKVFKGDLRVYDYGDPGNDWLGLDLKRVQNKEWFSNNQNIGFVYLDAETSGALVEKTNREGFIQNSSYEHFMILLEFILTEFKAERQSDREKWLRYNKKGTDSSFESQLTGFKELITSSGLPDDSRQKLLAEANRIEERYEQDKNTLLIPASVGMTVSFAMHEIDKLVPRMEESVKETPLNQDLITTQVEELKDYVGGILSVLKKGGNKAISLSACINQAVSNYASRLRSREISVVLCLDESAELVVCDKRLLITMLMNLLDNSIYWLDTVYRDEKKIMILTRRVPNGVAVMVVDNGPGFKDSIEDLVRPFFSRKENGIGIGLYLVDTVMIQYGKLNIIYDRNYLTENDVPESMSGAAVELIFNKQQTI